MKRKGKLMINKQVRRFIAFITGLLIIFTMFPMDAMASEGSQNPESSLDAEHFFRATSRLIYENWNNDFVDTIVFTVNNPTMIVDGNQMAIDPYSDTRPIIVDDMVMLPIDVIVDLAGGDIVFDVIEQTITVDAEQTIELEIGSTEAIVNGNSIYIESAPVVINGRPMVYVYEFAEYLGFEAKWNPLARELILTRDFQTMRLIVRTASHMDFSDLGASYVVRGLYDIAVLQFDTVYETQKAYALLSANSNVVWVEPDLIISPFAHSDVSIGYYYPFGVTEISIANTPRSWGVDRIGATRYAQYLVSAGRTTQPIVVAVIDTGVFAGHPFFQGRLVSIGRCFITNTDNAYDANGHGTHVAGTVVDSTPGLNNIRILPVKVIGSDGRGTSLAFGNGIRWSASQANVLNMSLGGQGQDNWITESVLYAINTHGATMVAAAGNANADAANVTPANIPQVIAIAAVDSENRPASFSNWGSPPIDIAAPGVNIDSTSLAGGFILDSGTSMSAPHVSAAVAMYILDNPALSPAQIQAAFRSYVTVPSGWNTAYGTGILNLDLAPRSVQLFTGWAVVEGGNRAFYQNGVRVGQGQAGPDGLFFAQGLVTPFGTADFLFNNQGHLLTGLWSYGNQWHYFDSAHGTRLLSGVSGWWGWELPPGQLYFLYPNGTRAENELATLSWVCSYGGPTQASYLFDADGFLVTEFEYDLAAGLSVHSAFGEWHVMATHSFNRVANFHEANGGGWLQPWPGALRYLVVDGTLLTGPATIVDGQTTIPAGQLESAWTILYGNEFLFSVDGYLQFGWVYADGVPVAYIGANGIRVPMPMSAHNYAVVWYIPDITDVSQTDKLMVDEHIND